MYTPVLLAFVPLPVLELVKLAGLIRHHKK
jgi:hypothetical protein